MSLFLRGYNFRSPMLCFLPSLKLCPLFPVDLHCCVLSKKGQNIFFFDFLKPMLSKQLNLKVITVAIPLLMIWKVRQETYHTLDSTLKYIFLQTSCWSQNILPYLCHSMQKYPFFLLWYSSFTWAFSPFLLSFIHEPELLFLFQNLLTVCLVVLSPCF